MRRVSIVAIVILTASTALGQTKASPPAPPPALSPLDSLMPDLEKLYLDLHQSPELSLHEEKTSAKMAERLRAQGFQVTTGVGGYGVVGILENGSGPVVMLRTDLDALPVEEKTGLPYASRVRAKDDAGNDVRVMHACGHDIHMTSWIGAATLLARSRARWRGTLMMVGQPAEEKGLPSVYNDPAVARRLLTALIGSLGEAAVSEGKPLMVSEDFAEYGRAGVPSVIFDLGAVDAGKLQAAKKAGNPLPGLHSSEWAPDYGPTIRTGATLLTLAALELLGKP